MSNNKSKKDKSYIESDVEIIYESDLESDSDIESNVEIIYESDLESDSDIESENIKDNEFDDDLSYTSSCSLLNFKINNNFYSEKTPINKKKQSESDESSESSESDELSESDSSDESSDSYKSEYFSDSNDFNNSDLSSESSDSDESIDSISSIKLALKEFSTYKKKAGGDTIFDNSTQDLLTTVIKK